jgi:hypothetical protein
MGKIIPLFEYFFENSRSKPLSGVVMYGIITSTNFKTFTTDTVKIYWYLRRSQRHFLQKLCISI